MNKVKTAEHGAHLLTDDLDYLIRDTRRLLQYQAELTLRPQGISPGAWFPLRILLDRDGISQRELSAVLGYKEAAAGVIVEAMEREGLISRDRDPDDRRRIKLSLSQSGRRKARLVHRLSSELQQCMVAGMSKQECAQLIRLLGKVHENLKTERTTRQRQ